MIFPVLHFDDYRKAPTDQQTRTEIPTAEELVQGSGVGGAPVVHATVILDVWGGAHDAETFLEERLEPLLRDLGLRFSRVGESHVWDLRQP